MKIKADELVSVSFSDWIRDQSPFYAPDAITSSAMAEEHPKTNKKSNKITKCPQL